jgi:ubiquinone/menaquinone biosynthesis C-methylase UbiE
MDKGIDKGTDKVTGWERERRVHFDEIVEKYDRIRPEFPVELFSDIFEYIGTDAGKKALEIGAGTGKGTVPLLDAGYDVTAVEMGANMASFLRKRFKSNRNFRVLVAAFEDALLDEGAYDLVYAAAAFHWVDAEIGCPKVSRLLKRGGTFALFRYNTIPANSEIYEEIQAVYEKYFFKPYKRPAKRTAEEFFDPSGIKRAFGFEDLTPYGFGDISMKLYDVSRTFDADEYITLLDTFSDHRSLPESDRAALYAGVKEVILKHGDRHKVDYVFQLYMGRKL